MITDLRVLRAPCVDIYSERTYVCFAMVFPPLIFCSLVHNYRRVFAWVMLVWSDKVIRIIVSQK